MPKFLVTKIITAELQVECADEDEAHAWSEKIVVGLEDEEGNPITLTNGIEFVADSSPAGYSIEILP